LNPGDLLLQLFLSRKKLEFISLAVLGLLHLSIDLFESGHLLSGKIDVLGSIAVFLVKLILLRHVDIVIGEFPGQSSSKNKVGRVGFAHKSLELSDFEIQWLWFEVLGENVVAHEILAPGHHFLCVCVTVKNSLVYLLV
jgi:hypothetical protein